MKTKGFLLVDALILLLVVTLICAMLTNINHLESNYLSRLKRHQQFNAEINAKYAQIP